jgi:YkoP domain
MRSTRTVTTATWQWRHYAAALWRSGGRNEALPHEIPQRALACGLRMPDETAAGASFDPARGDGRDGFWVALVGSIDAVLRAYHGIGEYTDDPACVFRVGLGPAREAVILADGTAIAAGELVGSLHLWNENLSPYTTGGPDLAWACNMRRRVLRSLQLLADVVERDPAWKGVRAFRGDATLSRRLGDVQIRRLARRYGFERVASRLTLLRRLHFLGDCFNTWALTRAFNPTALERQGFLRGRCEVWMSRRALIERYGRAARLARGRTAERTR